jgi:hypothetical protein
VRFAKPWTNYFTQELIVEGILDTAKVASILTRLSEGGWIFPVHYSVISQNGSMVLGRYWEPGQRGEIIASHCPSGQIVLPMNMMIVDERGEAALVKWLHDTEPYIISPPYPALSFP